MLHTSSHLPGWQVSLVQSRETMIPIGFPQTSNATRHYEKTGKHKTTSSGPYTNPLLDPWQVEMAKALHAGANVVVTSVTSAGKTWAATQIVAHEVLERDNRTALIISPNSLVMRDTVRDIQRLHTKEYRYARSMLSTQTRRYQTYDPMRKGGPPGQIMVITADSVVEFMINPVNKRFIDELMFIVFDEVHLSSVTDALWWSQYIPHTAQLVLLSATMGNPTLAKEIVDALQAHDPARPQQTMIFTQEVRPVPLQYMVHIPQPLEEGAFPPSLDSLKTRPAFSCVINPFDPTTRDLQSILGTEASIPETRLDQFMLGRKVMTDPDHRQTVNRKNAKAFDIAADLTPEHLYNVLRNVEAKDMAPVMVFSTTTDQTKTLAETLIGYISGMEQKDPSYRQARSLYESHQKNTHRDRDEKNEKKLTKAQKERKMDGGVNSKKSKKDTEWNVPENKSTGINLVELEQTLAAKRFKCDFKFENVRGVEQWILDCLEFGIGIYVNSMKTRIRYMVFDAVREGKIKVLFADSSISIGVNLPFRTVVICGAVPHDLFLQAGGRAGRRGMEERGNIIMMMPRELIEKYTVNRQPDVSLVMPTKMSFTSLIRLQIPANLSSAMEPDTTDMRPSQVHQAYLDAFNPSSPPTQVDPYHVTILNNYMKTLNPDQLEHCRASLQMIQVDGFYYHRLSNLIKMIPEDNSILLINLMLLGKFKELTTHELLELMAMLLFRVEASQEVLADPEAMKSYYVPDFTSSGIPNLTSLMQTWADRYDMGIDFSRPINRYIMDYINGKPVLDFIKQIDNFREWIYILKNNIERCAPSPNKGYADATSEAIYKADIVMMSASSSQGFPQVKKDRKRRERD
jgi:hypothetical protein